MFALNPRDPNPIYTQIKEQFIRLILSGVLSPSEKLPSVRQLAAQLSINPNTIQRAYAELETEGYCFSQAGRGSFVAERSDWQNAHTAELEDHYTSAAKELLLLGATKEHLHHLLDTL